MLRLDLNRYQDGSIQPGQPEMAVNVFRMAADVELQAVCSLVYSRVTPVSQPTRSTRSSKMRENSGRNCASNAGTSMSVCLSLALSLPPSVLPSLLQLGCSIIVRSTGQYCISICRITSFPVPDICMCAVCSQVQSKHIQSQ